MSRGIAQDYKSTTVLKMYTNISCLALDIYTNVSCCLRKPSVQMFLNLQLKIWKAFWLLENYYQTHLYIKNELELKSIVNCVFTI